MADAAATNSCNLECEFGKLYEEASEERSCGRRREGDKSECAPIQQQINSNGARHSGREDAETRLHGT